MSGLINAWIIYNKGMIPDCETGENQHPATEEEIKEAGEYIEKFINRNNVIFKFSDGSLNKLLTFEPPIKLRVLNKAQVFFHKLFKRKIINTPDTMSFEKYLNENDIKFIYELDGELNG